MGFERLRANGPDRLLPGFEDATVRLVRPFSWDAPDRGFEAVEVPVQPDGVTVVSGPYATADAAALEAGADLDFPGLPGDQAHRYLAQGVPAAGSARFQDGLGLLTVASPDGLALALAQDYSGTVLTTLRAEPGGLRLTVSLPAATFSPSAPAEPPTAVLRTGAGDHDVAEGWLREAVRAAIPARPDGPLTPPLIADTWGFGTAITPELVARFVDAAADLGVDVVTVDKGWEDEVGDWNAAAGYSGGLAALAAAVHARGVAFGLWCAAGNAAPSSRVLREHPEWRAVWRGRAVIQSHDTYVLCLGHEPARAYVESRLEALVEAGVDWLLHDFETIARCDSAEHTHDPGAGEHACEAGWYATLAALRARHPALVVENCWNGGRPVDLRMVAHHDTTIGDDWARSEFNRVAKLGLGRYLPSSWCTAYMSDEDLPSTSQLAPYVVGGPWVVMGDVAGWRPEHRALVRRAAEVYRAWRSPSLDRHVEAVVTEPALPAVGIGRDDGAQLAAVVVPPVSAGTPARWFPSPRPGAALYTLTDEWTGATRTVTAAAVTAGIDLDTSAPAGLLLSLTPSA
ncbi:alpha-galactosidase [Jiangella anatolica]|uniref:Alpha-galactosidase n=1 Tax=Jiangella anatolica TaxID=2670374 RepID=A0A2W2B2T0_9ACTN|nr:alpha-galactosidase [Jiangella anatolica]PZF80322.1 hypothetical protein C1I92_26600 [Jiangella anatolica]